MNTRQQVGLFLALFFAYLVVGGREPPWTDSRQIYGVAESLVDRGSISVDFRTTFASDGKYYAAHPFLTSAIHLPGAVIGKAAYKLWPDSQRLVRPLVSHLGPAALGATLGLLFFRLCLGLGSSLAAARFGAATVSFATMAAVYARSPYSEIAQTTAFLGFFMALTAWLERPTLRRAFIFGLCTGILCNTKMVFALALPGAAALAIWRFAQWPKPDRWRELGAHALRAVLGGLPGVILLFGYNYARAHSFIKTGYPTEQISGRVFGEWTLIGLWGLFFSIGKSVFLYSPPLIAALLLVRHALRTRPRLWAAVLLATAGPIVLFYGRFTFWHGDWCWGPRYILFLVPPALLPLVFAYDDLRLMHRPLARAAAATVFAAGFGVQVLGGVFYWDHFIRLGREAQTQWFGQPRREGATTPDTGNDCGPCIEDMYGLNWLPPLQPIAGHLWLLRHKARGHTAEEAEADAPWHRYTSLKLNVAGPYGRARIDWWLLDWKNAKRKDGTPNHRERRVGAGLFVFFVAGMAGGTALHLGFSRRRQARWQPRA